MNIVKLKILCITALLTAVSIPSFSATASELKKNIFHEPGKKQVAKDFNPAPAKISTNFGELNFIGGAYPSPDSAGKIYDEMDLQRATQAYMDFLPALSLYAILNSQVRDFGLKSSSDIGVMADFLTPSENYLTGNDVTVYAVGTLDLKLDGPTVVELPPGMLGTANGSAFKYVTDLGVIGPDKGKGGKYIFVPPGFEGDIPKGYFVFNTMGNRVWIMMRGFGDVGTGDTAVEWFKQRFKIYPLATGPRKSRAINVSGLGINTLPPEDGSAFQMLSDIIQYEPTELFNPELLGRLATLGIEKGKPFQPDQRMKRIFDQAAKQGVAMSRALVYASRDPDIKYWSNRQWEKMFVRNTEFTRNGYNDIDARTLWHYQAIVVSPNLIAPAPGVGTAYLTAFRDKKSDFLLGNKTYKLTVPPNPPAKRFWAVTAYDPVSRSLLDSQGTITVGSLGNPKTNADGSVDIFFSAEMPKNIDKENWIKTSPEKGFFVVFRFYGPLEEYIDKSWVMNDFELIE